MKVVSVEQARRHRLRAHHLDRAYGIEDAAELAGACGMQNTPPGAWETALFNRAPACRREDAERLLYGEKTLVQAWSLRGAPVVFPAAESAAFLSALVPAKGEPWAYTKGIGLALDALGMEFDRLLELLVRAMPRLDDEAIASKVALDQTLADWVEPLLPANKRAAWRQPSMYGSPDKQTVGGAAVSFLLRPCSFMGLVVFGERAGATPTFTSYRRWTGGALQPDADAAARLVRKFVHCYGPTRPDALAAWTGCSGAQARRMWKGIARAGAGGVRRQEGGAGGRPRCAARRWREVLPFAGHDPVSINATAPPCRPTFVASPYLKTVRTPASSRNGGGRAPDGQEEGRGPVRLAGYVGCLPRTEAARPRRGLRRFSGFEAVGRELRVASRLVPGNIANARFPDSMCGKIAVLARRARSEAVVRNTVGTRAGVSPGRFPGKGVEARRGCQNDDFAAHRLKERCGGTPDAGERMRSWEDLPKRSTGAGKE
ncbi:MAG: DNA glycosylase AlkZ-like family protein [Eggerthella lenta]